MQLFNCETPMEKELKSIDLTKLSHGELKSLLIDIQTDFMNGYLENEIIVTDALKEIAWEVASRCE